MSHEQETQFLSEAEFNEVIDRFNNSKNEFPVFPWEKQVFEWCEKNQVYDVRWYIANDDDDKPNWTQWQLIWPAFTLSQRAALVHSIRLTADREKPLFATMQVHTGINEPLEIYVHPDKVSAVEQNLIEMLSFLKKEADKITTEDLEHFSGLTA